MRRRSRRFCTSWPTPTRTGQRTKRTEKNRIPFPCRPLRVDDFVPFVGLREHLGEELWRVLQVGVHHGDEPAAGPVDAGSERHLVAEVPREAQGPEARVLGSERGHRLERAVTASVVDEEDLERPSRRLENRDEAAAQFRQVRELVEAGKDDGDLGHAHLPGFLARSGRVRTTTFCEPTGVVAEPSLLQGRRVKR